MRSSTATSSASVELFVFNFCHVDDEYTNPFPRTSSLLCDSSLQLLWLPLPLPLPLPLERLDVVLPDPVSPDISVPATKPLLPPVAVAGGGVGAAAPAPGAFSEDMSLIRGCVHRCYVGIFTGASFFVYFSL